MPYFISPNVISKTNSYLNLQSLDSCFSSSISDGKKKAKIDDDENGLSQLLLLASQMLKKCEKIEFKIEKLDSKLSTET